MDWPDRGGIYGAVRPDPFPNSEVKRARADDSSAYAGAKVGSRRLMLGPSQKDGLFVPIYNFGIDNI